MQQPKMSQQGLALRCQVDEDMFGITKEVISKIERGVRSVSDTELKAIAKVLNVSVDWLIKDTDDHKRRS
jgi:transcriptional regulator with XRE-family HTH domain